MNNFENRAFLQEYQYPVTKNLDLSDRDIISWYTGKYNYFCCEYSFPSLLIWNDIYHYKISFFNNWLIIFDTRLDYILMPMGEGLNLKELINLSTILKQDGYSGDIANVPPEFMAENFELGRQYEIENERALAEYIYSSEKLFALNGKKLRKKRNLVSQFVRHFPDYQVTPLNSTVRRDCLVMVEKLLSEMHIVSKSIREETIAMKKAFENFDSIPLDGIAIYSDNSKDKKLVCFSIYSRLNLDVFTIHFEKVNYSHPGAAQAINWETAKVLKDQCRFINREQDLGIPGLRKAKLSYDPESIYPSIFLTFKG